LGTNVISAITRTYDAAGRLTVDQQTVSDNLPAKSVNYVYDDDGKVTRTFVDGASYDYDFSYDGMGRFEKILVHGSPNPSFQYYYDAASNEKQRFNFLNRVTQIYPRDALNRMSRLDVMKDGTTLSSEVYGYDPMNRLTSVSREDSTSDSFGYYLDGELNTAQYGWASGMLAQSAATARMSTDTTTGTGKPLVTFSIGPSNLSTKTTNTNTTQTMDTMAATSTILRSVTYNLDKAGNRTSIVDTGTTKTYTPNILNQYTAVEGLSVTNGSEHEIASYQGANYTYINDERPSSVTDGINIYSVAYDALGRCIRRTYNADTAYYIYDGEKPILEYYAGTNIARSVYGKGIDEILMRTDYVLNQTYYYQQDHEGSITHLTDASGNVIEKYRYDAFGTPTYYDGSGTQIGGSNYNNRFLFTGREFMGVWYEYRARFYHPILGRFMSEDPKLFDAGDYNLFRYCHNDPIDFTDPMGLSEAAPTNNPRETSLEREGYWSNARDAMAKWADSSNNFQGTFSQFTAGQGLTMGQVSQTTVPRMTREEAIQKYGPYVKGTWGNEDKYIIDYRVPQAIMSDPNYNMRWDKAIPKVRGTLVTHFSTNRDIAPGITAALENLRRAGQLGLLVEFNGSFFFRMTRGGGNISAHAYGLGVDVNGSMNPQGHPSHQPAALRAAFTGAGFVDGGTWPSPQTDGMHFSVGF
jgi:RHS repeat-associated protein